MAEGAPFLLGQRGQWLDHGLPRAGRGSNQGDFTARFRRVSPVMTAENGCAETRSQVFTRFGGYEARTIYLGRTTLVACSAPGQVRSARLIGDGMAGRGQGGRPAAAGVERPGGALLQPQPGSQKGGVSGVRCRTSGHEAGIAEAVGRQSRSPQAGGVCDGWQQLPPKGVKRVCSGIAEAQVETAPAGSLSPDEQHSPWQERRGGPQRGVLSAMEPPTAHQRDAPARSAPRSKGLKTVKSVKRHAPQTI